MTSAKPSNRQPEKLHNKKAPGLACRQAASQIIWYVLFNGTYLDEAFEVAMREFGLAPRDRSLARAIAATTLRRLGQIKQALDTHMKKPLAPKLSHGTAILYTSAAQILFMDVPDRAAVDLGVAQLRKHKRMQHLSGMANAVLRKLAREKPVVDGKESEKVDPAQQPGRVNTPKWLWQLWAKDYGKPVADKIANAHLAEAAIDLSVRQGRKPVQTPKAAVALPLGALRLETGLGRVADLAGFKEGDWWVQDFAASIPAKLFGDIKGLSIVDLCAAPGGKTLQLADAGAEVTAVDISDTRLKKVRENLDRVGLEAKLVCADAGDWQPNHLFEGVLLDAPCSATGTIRRHPDALYLKKSSDIDALVKIQRSLLDHAAGLVMPGGMLVYCTCSLQHREGEGQVARFLEDHLGFERVPVTPSDLDGLSHLINSHGDIRTLPFYPVGSTSGMDGFFISRLRRKM